MCETCLKLTISGVFIVNFEHISQLFQVFLLLTLNNEMLAGYALFLVGLYLHFRTI